MCGAFVGTPAELALVRMTADGKLPEAEKRNYKNVFDALVRICKQEGVFMMWRGAIPTMTRSMVVNGAQLASYSQAKELLLGTGSVMGFSKYTSTMKLNCYCCIFDAGYFKDNIPCHFTSSMISGLITTSVSMPVDIAKTRYSIVYFLTIIFDQTEKYQLKFSIAV